MVISMKMEKDKIKCECGEFANPKVFNVEGFRIRGWQCAKCGRIEYSDEINEVLIIKKLKKQPISIRVGTLGLSEFIRIPKEIQHLTRLKKGEEVIIYPESTKKLILELKD